MHSRAFRLCAAMSLLAALAITVQVSAEDGTFHFTVLNDPQAVSPYYTASTAINDLGVVAGNYQGANGVFYGFVSSPPYSKTSYTTVEFPAAPFTYVPGMNLEGAVVGWTLDTSGVFHGFLSHPPYATVTPIEVPGACSQDVPACENVGGGETGWNINLEGVIAGHYVDADGVFHGFVSRPPYTRFTTIDAPGACASGTTCSGLGTVILSNSLSDLGVITGYYLDASNVGHGYVSYPPYGKTDFRTFDAPGACSSGSACTYSGTYPESINLEGVITGTYYDAYGVGHGFVGYPPYTKSTFISFDAPGACSSDTNPACYVLQGTVPQAINWEGVITGYFQDSNDVAHGFVTHPPYITISTFDAPDACSSGSGCSGSGTFAYGINLEEQIAGLYIDASGSGHGFVAHRERHGY